MGDSVNLGSRLEGANKSYRTNILISEYTHAQVRDEFACMEVDSVRVKGKSQPVKIFQLLGERGIPEDQMEAVRLFESGLALYKQQKWDDAMDVFDRVMKMQKGVNAAEIYIQRALDLKSDPPPPDWNGVYIMKTK
jgi:adenylate cyclase